MAADYTDSKGANGAVFPDGSDNDENRANWSTLAPLITPEQVIRKHLFGIPLVSGTKDPITKQPQRLTSTDIVDQIDDAIATVALETGMSLFPEQKTDKLPFDINDYKSFGFLRLKNRPVASIESMTVTPSDELDIYEVPLDWIETGNLHRGQVNLIPLTIALTKQGSLTPTATTGGALMLSLLGYSTWIPSFWRVRYTVGFPSGKVPKVVNNLIGTVAAIEVLSLLASTYAKNQSGSLSIDGMSQSISTPGPQIFTQRIADLTAKRALLTKKLKTWAGLTLFSASV